MAEVLEAMGFPSEWCETALESSSGLETAVDLLLQWQVNGVPQHFVPSTLSSAPDSSSRGKKPILQHEQTDSGSLPAGRAPTLKLVPLPGSASKTFENGESEQSPSSILLPSSFCHSSLEMSSGVNHQSSSESSGDTSFSDAVVPDVLAEEREARYLAARREKQEKEATRDRIRQQMREDMATRRSRHHHESPSMINKGKSIMAHEGEGERVERTSGYTAMDTDVELHIRCPWNQNLKGSFRASTRLKDVRAYVEQQAEQRPYWVGIQERRQGHLRDDCSRLRLGSLPFSGRSACISDSVSSQRLEEKELLKAARENFEIRTRQIVASAKSLRNDSSEKGQSYGEPGSARIYFVIPFPKKEFLTESAMESTLAEAQLVPTGTLVVQYGMGENGQQVCAQQGESRDISEAAKVRSAGTGVEGFPLPTFGSSGDIAESPHVEQSEDGFRSMVNAARESGRALETEGERVRIREQALQAAAKRMSEAAKIFRAGVPLEVGETGQAFHFPEHEENQNVEKEEREDDNLITSSSVARPAVQRNASMRLPNGTVPNNVEAAGADAELAVARNKGAENRRYPANRLLDPPHLMAVAAAEERLRNPQPLRVAEESSQNDELSEKETTSQGEISRHQLRGRGRMSGALELRPRPEKQQRTSSRSLPGTSGSRGHLRSTVQQLGRSNQQPSRSPGDAERRAESLKAAMQRCKEAVEGDNKGKALVEDALPEQMAPSSSSPSVEPERTSTLRVRLEDGSVVSRIYAASTRLQLVRDSVTPDAAAFSDYGLVVPFPEPRFMEGDDLDVTLEDVGLVPRGTIHLTKVSTRGIVREGRRPSRRRQGHDYDDDYFRDDLFQRWDGVLDEDFTYEDMMQLEDSIGRVHVGVPEEMVTLFPTRIVEGKAQTTATDDVVGGESDSFSERGEFDLCTVCMAEMVPKEEILSLPCLHTYHSLCIKKWLRQSTHCPTCKRSVV